MLLALSLLVSAPGLAPQQQASLPPSPVLSVGSGQAGWPGYGGWIPPSERSLLFADPSVYIEPSRGPFERADLTGDGIDDVIVESGIGNLRILVGRGNGSFIRGRAFPSAVGIDRIRIGDLDGDGQNDVVLSTSSTFGVHLGEAGGSLGAVSTISAPGTLTRDFLLGDWNGDGHLDLAATTSQSPLATAFGQGDGTFLPWVLYPSSSGGQALASGDLNGDAITDLVVAQGTSHGVRVFLGEAGGSFSDQGLFPVGKFPSHVSLGDFDRDGALDLLVDPDDQLQLFLGAGDGSFGGVMVLSHASYPTSFEVADLNGDGSLDVVVVEEQIRGLGVLLGNGDGTFAAENLVPGSAWTDEVKISDLDRDGAPDLLRAHNRSIEATLGNGDGTFASRAVLPSGDASNAMLVRDWNGDGIGDVLSAFSTVAAVALRFGSSTGTFSSEVQLPTPGPVYSFVAGDLNGDGVDDLVATLEGTAPLLVWLADGSGSFQAVPDPIPANLVFQRESFLLGDFDGSGTLDLAIDVNGLRIYPGRGDGTFDPGLLVGTVGPVRMVQADLNLDGHLDIVGTNRYRSEVSVYLGVGDGTFQNVMVTKYQYPVDHVVCSDFNRDGLPDLIVESLGPEGYLASVLLGQGDGTFVRDRRIPIGIEFLGMLQGDMNGDGLPDFVTFRSEGFELWRGRGEGSFRIGEGFGLLDLTRAAAIGDVDGDGKLDVVAGGVGGTTFAGITVQFRRPR